MKSALAILLLLAASAHADPVRLRIAALAPEGTAWAREIHALTRDIKTATHGEVELKWYLGGIAGEELVALERIRKGQLDGMAGALFCEKLAPSFRVGRVVGLFQTRDEAQFVLGTLRQKLNEEFAQSGFVSLGTASFGNMMIFSRKPIRTLADLRSQRLWTYDVDELLLTSLRNMGANMVALPVGEGARAYDENRIDGFVTSPTVTLAFQWSARARYYTPLTISMLPGCFVVSQRAFDSLSIENQKAVRTASAKFVARFEDLDRTTESLLLGGVFDRQGLKRVPITDAIRMEFFEVARRAREKLPASLVDPHLLERVLALLADYRGLRDSASR